MTGTRKGRSLMVAVSLLEIILLGPALIHGQDDAPGKRLPEGVYMELTKDFYEALKGGDTGGVKVYTNDPSSQYLREIAVSTRFMVETNLRILKQQERMIQLLESLSKGKKN